MNIPDDNLLYSVLLSLDEGKGYGSGFRLKHKENNFLVTAKHVIYKDDSLAYSNLLVTCPTSVYEEIIPVILKVELKKAKIYTDPKYDIAIILIGSNEQISKEELERNGYKNQKQFPPTRLKIM